MKRSFVLLMSQIAVMLYGYDRSESIYDAIGHENYALADSLLNEWDLVDPQDPELYLARFNRYINQSRQEVLLLTTDKSDGEMSLVFSDSLGNRPALSVSE